MAVLCDILDIPDEGIQCQIGQLLSILTQKMWSFWNPKNASLKKYRLNRKNEQKMVIIFEDLKTPHFWVPYVQNTEISMSFGVIIYHFGHLE